ncbi:carbohydrate-binding module family 1 protein [Piromyces sp. E2]|nr:carbohydrate-binding module family 1 protein [Piromyces sp. E2]|eukprot:OUM58441.1 carbohydrate-binding module family 1 protein [Piromyces sp. E2]
MKNIIEIDLDSLVVPITIFPTPKEPITITTKKIPITTTTTTKKIPITTTNTTKKIPITCKNVTITIKETVTVKETITVTIQNSEPTPTNPVQNCAAKWGQCGGQGYNGPTCCQSGSTCHEVNQWYSQCL